MTMNRIIVSRHPAGIQFIREEAGLPEDTPVLSSATAEDIAGKTAYGNLPLHLAAEAASVVALEFENPPRGAEYTIEDMRAAGARLSEYAVVRLDGSLEALQAAVLRLQQIARTISESGKLTGNARDRFSAVHDALYQAYAGLIEAIEEQARAL